ncbi:MAG: UDP-3-O-(3-hydroxymyristoyl)glucosamine N-acyltransferase [Alphaproteobacteria bacterium CG_4_9_14_3_um_filter_47_13]|nr:MAG: UDP-3-O-(3-hydroxymyristoyl)glucosamine N-acyltransferase [Alphaproteobacteria bacterium CG_4_9_14_3_um_filter_47_13]
MPDPRFHKCSAPLTLGALAKIAGAALFEGADSDRIIKDVAPLDKAGSTDISFLDNIRYKEQFIVTKAGACIVTKEMASFAPKGVSLLITSYPYKAYALIAQSFYPQYSFAGRAGATQISEKAVIHDTAKIGKGCVIGSGVVIGANAEIGEGCCLDPNTVIGEGVLIGNHCTIGANVTISHSLIGHDVNIYPGCCIGQDGFGFAIDPAGHIKVPQLGRVIIGDHVEIGANTTIDRGAGPDTEIGSGTWIDNLVQIGHNVRIGKGCVIVAQVGISGSTVLEDYVVMGGQAGIAGHLHMGKGARIGAQSGVMRNVPAGSEVLGSPAMPIRQTMRQIAALNRLIKNRTNG